MSNESNEKLAKIFENFTDDCVFLSNSEAETYGITIRDYAQKHSDEVLNNYLNECLKYYEELVERIQACEDKIKDYDFYADEPVRRGQWINKGDYAICSECGASSGTQYNGLEPIPRRSRYCPNCGAKMDSGGRKENERV